MQNKVYFEALDLLSHNLNLQNTYLLILHVHEGDKWPAKSDFGLSDPSPAAPTVAQNGRQQKQCKTYNFGSHLPHRNRSQSCRIIYQNKGNLSLHSNSVVKIRSEKAHKSAGQFFCANRDRSSKSSINIAKFEFRKLDFAKLNFIAMISETIF